MQSTRAFSLPDIGLLGLLGLNRSKIVRYSVGADLRVCPGAADLRKPGQTRRSAPAIISSLLRLARRLVLALPCLLVSLYPCPLVLFSPCPSVMAQKPAAGATSDPSAAQLIEQGKSLYRAQRLKPALAKFEAALKLAPVNDEALSLAAVTAFRLDLQPQSRDYFLRRANLTRQKDSVKAFSYYRVALTYWREVHDLVAKFVGIKENKIVAPIP